MLAKPRWSAHAGVLHPVISYSTEFIDIWFARDLTAGQREHRQRHHAREQRAALVQASEV